MGSVGKKRLLILLVVIIAILSVAAYLLVISPSLFGEEPLELSECLRKMSEWCYNCYYVNDGSIYEWDKGGTKLGKSLAECSNEYFDTAFVSDKDCVNALDFCMPFLEEVPE